MITHEYPSITILTVNTLQSPKLVSYPRAEISTLAAPNSFEFSPWVGVLPMTK